MIINEGRPGKKLPTLTNPGVAGDLLSGKQLIGQDGNIITGTIPSKASTDISVSGRTVTVPAGYYPSQARKSIASATQATPSITVSSGGLITASATQSAGYVASGTKSATKQLTTQAGKTVTPGTSQQTAVASGRYTTGTVYVAGDADLVASNIKKGVNIFGVAGTYDGGLPSNVFEFSNSSAVSGSNATLRAGVDDRDDPVYWVDIHFGSSVANAIKSAQFAVISFEALFRYESSTASTLGGGGGCLILKNGVIEDYIGNMLMADNSQDFGIDYYAGFLRDIEDWGGFNPSSDGTWSFIYAEEPRRIPELPDLSNSRFRGFVYYSN